MRSVVLFTLCVPTVVRAEDYRELAFQRELDAVLIIGLLSLVVIAVRRFRAIVSNTSRVNQGRRRVHPAKLPRADSAN
jgi:hypothetical protein